MRKEINILNYKINPYSLIIVIFFSMIFVALGTWQIFRLEYKNDLIKKINYNVSNEAIDINNLLGKYSIENLPNFYKISVKGKFLENKNIFLYAQKSSMPGKHGYYVLSPFIDENNNVFLVSKGWVSADNKNKFIEEQNKLSTEKKLIETTNIQAIILPGEKKNFFVPNNDINKNIWFTIDLLQSKKYFNTSITNYYLMQINNNSSEFLISLSTNNLSKVRNDHLEYAITWYILAVLAILMYIIYIIKHGKKVDN